MNAVVETRDVVLPDPKGGLTQAEVEFVYHVEILGLPARKAAQLAGMPLARLNAPHLLQAREMAKRALRGSMQITKEDVVWNMQDAIGRARLLGDPATEILGWEKIARLLGYDVPQTMDVNIAATIEVLKSHVRSMGDAELARFVGAHQVIDADFYDVSAKTP